LSLRRVSAATVMVKASPKKVLHAKQPNHAKTCGADRARGKGDVPPSTTGYRSRK
jgi:hypothetical protein